MKYLLCKQAAYTSVGYQHKPLTTVRYYGNGPTNCSPRNSGRARTLSGGKALMELGSARAPFSAAWISLPSLEHIFTLINRSLNRFMLIVRSTLSLFPRGGTKVHSVVVYEAKLQNVRFCTHLNCHRFLRELFYAAVNNCLLISNVHPASDPSLACSPRSYQITVSPLRNHYLSLGLTFTGCCSPNLRQRHPLLTYLPQITLPAATSAHTVLATSEKNIIKKKGDSSRSVFFPSRLLSPFQRYPFRLARQRSPGRSPPNPN